MNQYKYNEKLLEQIFQESLKEGALIWFAGLRAEDISTWEELAQLFV